MKNVVLIALVILVVLFLVYQYDPTVFGLFASYDGFADVTKAGGAAPSADAHGSEKAGQLAASGASQQAANVASAAKPATGNPQSAGAAGAELKQQPQAGKEKKEGFADLSAYEGPANFSGAEAPAGCYPRDQLTPSELLPKDMNTVWSEQNPMGPGSLKGKNFLSAGALIGVNTVGQSLRNANMQLRSEPANPQVAVSIFNQSTITPDISHRPLEIGA